MERKPRLDPAGWDVSSRVLLRTRGARARRQLQQAKVMLLYSPPPQELPRV